MPVWAIAAAAPTVSRRFLGFRPERATAIASERPGVKRSIVCIHFGVAGPASPRGRSRHCLTATISASTPSTIFSQLTQVAGWPESLALAPLETSSTTVPTSESPTIQPSTKAGPLRRARGVASISTTATIGSGLMATPTENDRT